MIIDIVIALFIFFVILPLALELCCAVIVEIATHFKELAQVAGLLLGIWIWGSLSIALHKTRWEGVATNVVGFLVCAAGLAFLTRPYWAKPKS